jgi:hypothetical protein
MNSRHNSRLFVPAACLLLAAASCSGGGTTSPTAPTQTTPGPPVSGDLAPSALQGTWMTILKDGTNQRVTLALNERSYRITRGADAAAGAIVVRGDQIEFSGSNVCNGAGVYRWSLNGNSVQFVGTPVASDPCAGRAEVLDGYTYTKSSQAAATARDVRDAMHRWSA